MITSMQLGAQLRRAQLLNSFVGGRNSNWTISVGTNAGYQVSEATSLGCDITTFRGRQYGKVYFEVEPSASGTFDCAFGLLASTAGFPPAHGSVPIMAMRSNGSLFVGTSGASTGTGLSYTTGQRCMVAADFDAKKVWMGRNGTWANSGDPAAGTGALFSGFVEAIWEIYLWCDNNSGGSHTIVLYNGQDGAAFSYSVPTGFERGLKY